MIRCHDHGSSFLQLQYYYDKLMAEQPYQYHAHGATRRNERFVALAPLSVTTVHAITTVSSWLPDRAPVCAIL
jgi:phage terminase large subunit-like protein